MFETSSEQATQNSSVIVLSGNSTSSPNCSIISQSQITTLTGSASSSTTALGLQTAFNEALVDVIDTHSHAAGLNMLSSYYYCTANLLDFKHHYHQSHHAYAQFMPTAHILHQQSADSSSEMASESVKTDVKQPANSAKTEITASQKLEALAEPSKPNKKSPIYRLFKRNSKRLETNNQHYLTSTNKTKLTGISKLKALLFKTSRIVTARNRLRYQRPHRYSKSASLSPTSPSSSSSSSSSSCSSSPELTTLPISSSLITNPKPKAKSTTSIANNTYKRFKKIRNRLLKCNMTELINEEDNTGNTKNLEDELTPVYSTIQLQTIADPDDSSSKETESYLSSSSSIMQLTTLQTTTPISYCEIYPISQDNLSSAYHHQHPHSHQQFSYDVDMLPPPSLETEEVLAANIIAESAFQVVVDSPIALQQCQIKQDLLKMSYEKFKQFRLNEKLLQQTVLIRNAIKMLQYDIQFQQEQEQILIQQQQKMTHHKNLHQQHQHQIDSNNASCLGYSITETCQLDVMQHQQLSSSTPCNNTDYLSSTLTSNLIASSPLPPPQNQACNNNYATSDSAAPTLINNGFKNINSNPMLNATYENFDEFINNNLLNLNTQITINNNINNNNNNNINKQHVPNSIFNNERIRPESGTDGGKSIDIEVDEDDFEDDDDESDNSEEDEEDEYSDNDEENDVNNNNLINSNKQQITNDTITVNTNENEFINGNQHDSLNQQ